jgi:hypothetical protein
MKVQYKKNHNSGKAGEVKEQSDEFANYLILKGVAIAVKELKTERETKEDKTVYQTKVKGDGQIVEPKEVRVKNVSK